MFTASSSIILPSSNSSTTPTPNSPALKSQFSSYYHFSFPVLEFLVNTTWGGLSVCPCSLPAKINVSIVISSRSSIRSIEGNSKGKASSLVSCIVRVLFAVPLSESSYSSAAPVSLLLFHSWLVLV